MKAAAPLLAVLLAGLSPAVDATTATAAGATTATAKPMADESSATAATAAAAAAAAAHPEPLSKQKRKSIHLRGRDGKPGRSHVVTGSVTGTGGKKDVTGSEDEGVLAVFAFADDYMKTEHPGVAYVMVKAEVQVVAGLKYTLHYEGGGEKRVVVVFAQPWLNKLEVQHDETECTDDTECPHDTESPGS